MESLKKQKVYETCKKIVKQWENGFMKNYGRPPSKLDIREADKDVRHAYCMYFKLKTAFLEESLMDVLNDDNDNSAEINISDSVQNMPSNISHSDSLEESNNSFNNETEEQPKPDDKVWGEHLNNKIEIVANKVTEQKKEDLNSTFAKKLFANAKFAKRNPRKSLNSSRHNSLNISQSQPTTSAETITEEKRHFETEDNSFSTFNSSLPIKSDYTPFPRSQSINVISHLLDNGSISNRRVDSGWLQRVSEMTGTKLPDIESPIYNETKITSSIPVYTQVHNDDDVISDSDDETSRTYHLSKRIKLSPTVNSTTLKPNTSVINISNIIPPTNLSNKPPEIINNTLEPIKKIILTPVDTKIPEEIDKVEKENNESKIVNKIEMNTVENRESKDQSDEEDSDNEPLARKRKRNCTTTSNARKPAGRKWKNIIESDESEKETTPGKHRRRRPGVKNKIKDNIAGPVKKSTGGDKTARKNTRGKNKKPVTETNEPEDEDKMKEEFEMEYSVKPPPVTVPRFKTIKNLESETTNTIEEPNLLLTKKEIAKNKLLKKIESGSLNDNYVRIDIKKKVFVRGKKHMNFTKYKKQMWKNKKKALYGPDMDMGGCDGGELTCFKCGKTGHMARRCKEKLADTLLPLDAVAEEECLLPSLEEATQMARDSGLAVRIPNLFSQSSHSSSQSEKRSENSEIDHDLDEKLETDSKTSEYEINDDEELEKFMLQTEVVDDEHMKSQQEMNKKWMKILEQKSVQPIYKLNEDGSLPETPKEVFDALKEFGHTSFRSGQEQAIMRILCGQSTLVTLSTGSGKSLCYQLPAYLYAKRKNCVSLVISPLVSLMDDQVSGMPPFLKAACLHTAQTATQKNKVLELIELGELNILLVSPEAVTSGEKKSGFGAILRKLPQIAFACIDEAHCVSQWSHNFRPSYLVICRVLKERLGIRTVLGLTATSTHATSTSILEHLEVPDGHNGVISDIPLPDNLFLSVSSDMQRDAALRNLLMADRYDEFNSIIIYCTRREECERIAAYLRTSLKQKELADTVKKYKSLSAVAEPYHAGLPASKRRTVQNAFMGGYLRIVVATIAFGMGINKSDIRGIIHYNMPSSFESYVQEVGRAGRDGLPGHCHLFLDCEGKDQNELRRHIYANSMDRHAVRKLLQKIFVPCDCKRICPRHEVSFSIQETVKLLDVPEENISTLLCYLELHERQYLEVLTPVYIMCKIIAYGSANNIKKAAKDCPPLAMALALQKKGETDMKENVFEFPVVDVAAAMGWDSGIVKSKLKNLEWISENNASKRSTLTVEFSNLGFHVRAPGNLSPSELDDALDSLFAKKNDQETTSLRQLQVVHTTLTKVSEKYYHLCLSEKYSSKSLELKTKIREYFSCEHPLKNVEIESRKIGNDNQIAADVRSLVAMYRDNNFTGRAAARIFHGIQSPNYPAVIWGRCKFWRAHLNSDFNKVCQIATTEILRLK